MANIPGKTGRQLRPGKIGMQLSEDKIQWNRGACAFQILAPRSRQSPKAVEPLQRVKNNRLRFPVEIVKPLVNVKETINAHG